VGGHLLLKRLILDLELLIELIDYIVTQGRALYKLLHLRGVIRWHDVHALAAK